MTLITFQDGQPVMRDGKVGTEQACCCGGCTFAILFSGEGACGLPEDNPYFDPNDGTCDAIQAGRDYLAELYQSAGWNVTTLDSTSSEQTQTECNSPIDCFFGISATCSSDMCWLFSVFGDDLSAIPDETLLDDSLFLPVVFPEGSQWFPALTTMDECCEPTHGNVYFPNDDNGVYYVPICQANPFP